ncbi:hypothetical protein CS078_16035 [Pseudomonas prosekii]|uniref:CD-NTase associated protein 4-like DNA endonuclease domain-containing protein n=1 Tax=Pseudomonas prosekii TaxID=1148509 RepID=A0A3L8CU28_9PSED|nr:hypothetical protein [Pseudomonas prosekii]RLU08398.1 hypothetical protein CS078_16035 [Pseudomonas prosekii]RLU11752.1 hypothetical protein CS076_08855 [Pseudomonas prosekii]
MDSKLNVDATKLFEALQYQLLVAVDHCFELEKDECVWLEVYGDVTVPGKAQVEVKFYTGDLTDGHSNFWNTLKNWMNEKFDHVAYKTLVLLTTQEFGSQATLAGWNTRTVADKISAMEAILQGTEERFVASKKTSIPASLKLQRVVMDSARRGDLIEILKKVVITTNAETLTERLHRIKKSQLTAIRTDKQQQFIDELLGFMSSTELVANGWKITRAMFDDKFSELNARHMRFSNKFPEVDIDYLKRTINVSDLMDLTFVKKIQEVGGDDHIKKAALHKLIAEQTIAELFSECRLHKPDLARYQANQLGSHLSHRASQMIEVRKITDMDDLKAESMKFYHQRHAQQAEQLCSFENTTIEFRNGVYHLLAEEQPEDIDDEFHWKLWK